MYSPSFADMADDVGFTSHYNTPSAIRSATHIDNFDGVFARSCSSTAEVPVLRRTMCRVVSEHHLQSVASVASIASTIEQSRCGSTVSRSDSIDSWSRVSDLPVARQLQRHAKVAGRPGPLERERPAGAVLTEWPAVDDDAFASSKKHLLTFDLDPTTLPSDVLCHLAMEMFLSAGLPEGVGEESVRRFILAVRASMLDNPYHNFYHAFDVMQTTNALATSTGTMARLDAWERFALLSAALW
jgi:hypothetical protein